MNDKSERIINKKMTSYSYEELKEKIGISFFLKEIKKESDDVENYFNYINYIKKIAHKLASTKIEINEVTKIKEEIIKINEDIHKKEYIAQEVFVNTKNQNENLPVNHDKYCGSSCGKGYIRFHDSDEELKRNFLSLKINDNELSKKINSAIDEIINYFNYYNDIYLPNYNNKKTINMIFKSKSLKHKISIAQMLISELKKISKYYLERSVDSVIEDIKTVYLKDIGNSFNTYEIPEIVGNKVYLVDKNTFSIKEVSVSLYFYFSILKSNELSKGNFFTNFYIVDKDNEEIACYELNNDNKLSMYCYNNYLFLNKEDAKVFSKEKLNKLIAYSNKVKDMNDNF